VWNSQYYRNYQNSSVAEILKVAFEQGGMIRSLLARLRSWWAVDDAEERIEGEGGVHLDPAYNSRYTAERHLDAYSKFDENPDESPDESIDQR